MNGATGYQSGEDLLIELKKAVRPEDIAVGTFGTP